MAGRASQNFICEHCKSEFLTASSLRSHSNRNRRCREKAQLISQLTNTPEIEDVDRVVTTTAFLGNEEDDFIHMPQQETNVIAQSTFNKPKLDSPFALSCSFRKCIGGRGLSNEDISEILSVVLHPEFDPTTVPFTTGRACKNWLKRKMVTEKGDIEKSKLLNIAHSDDIIVKFHYFDPVRALLSLLDVHFDKTYFVKNAAKKYNKDNQRVYNTPESAHWWNDTQESLRKDTGDNSALVLALIFYSDACQLSGKGNKSAHPVVFSLANIPLYHRRRNGGYKLLGLLPIFQREIVAKSKTIIFNQCLEMLIAPFKEMSERGFNYKGTKLYTFLFAYVHDYPEGCKVSATGYGNQVNFPCSSCYAPKDKLNNISRGFSYRTIDAVKDLVEENNEATLHDDHSAFPIKCAFWGFKYSNEHFGSPYECLMVDALHQTDQGVFKHMMEFLRNHLGQKKLKIIEKRHKFLLNFYWIGCLQLPASRFWLEPINIQGFEHRAAMQVVPFLILNIADDNVTKAYVLLLQWYTLSVRKKTHTEVSLNDMARAGISLVNHLKLYFPQTSNWMIPKIHAIQHYYNDIKRGGVPCEYSSEMWENLHKTLMKGPYMGSNKKHVEGQLMDHHTENWTLETITDALEDEEDIEDASIITENVLPETSYLLKLQENLSGPYREKWRRFESALAEYLQTNYDDYEELGNIQYYTSCDIGRTSEGESRDWKAYANASHHYVPKYNFVSVHGEEDNGKACIWYCRIISFLKFNVLTMSSDDIHKVAYVEYLKKSSFDTLLKCPIYVWESASKRYKIVDLSNVIKIVHIVPKFKHGDLGSTDNFGEFYVNQFLFRNLED